jgi:hypothetical protein
MNKRLLAFATAAVATGAIATGAAVAAGTDGAKANVARYRSAPKFVAPGPAFDA